ncbi:hypothetical protein HDV00_005501 [Rhizophlyctis rosea]|nr:hypothetical protein HDV00_005501 [Rhizophlyctis rosea]
MRRLIIPPRLAQQAFRFLTVTLILLTIFCLLPLNVHKPSLQTHDNPAPNPNGIDYKMLVRATKKGTIPGGTRAHEGLGWDNIPGQIGVRDPTKDLEGLPDELKLFTVNTRPKVYAISHQPGGIHQHHGREHQIYTLMTTIIRLSPPSEGPQMIDAGMNHGIYSLVAAASGARFVYAFEPLPTMQKRVRLAARLNQVDDRLWIYPKAVLDVVKQVNMTDGSEWDGGVNHITLNQTLAATKPDTFTVSTIRIDLLNLLLPNQPVSFMKVDIEGFEIQGLYSAEGLFKKKQIRHVVVEWGPPQRWLDFLGQKKEAAVKVMEWMYEHGFEIAVLPSIGYEKMKALSPPIVDAERLVAGVPYLHIAKSCYAKFTDALDIVEEVYLWFYLKDDPQVEHLFNM